MSTEISSLYAKVGADISDLQKKMAQTRGEMDKTAEHIGARARAIGDKMSSLGKTMTFGVTLPLVGMGAMALKASADFEQAGNRMQAISGATATEMDALRQRALQLGKDTVFSAGEAMQGMLELSKAGLAVGQTFDAIDGTLKLAAAASIDVAKAAEISANAMNVFGLKGKEINRVADILAATANSSSVEITDIADSLQMAGAMAAAAGMPIEDLATAIGVLGNQGIKGSDAGTSLKQMLLQLQAPSDKAAKLMESIGLSVYDASGKMLSLREIIANLQTATAEMTQQERDFALATIFGSDAVRSANVLITQGVSGFDRMSKSVNEAGAAQKMADANMKGLAGAIEYLKGSLETMMISTGTPWLDMLSGMIRGTADLIAKFGELPAPVQQAATVFGILLAAAGPLLMLFGSMASGLGSLIQLFGWVAKTTRVAAAAQWVLNAALSANPIGIVVIALAALAAGLVWAYQNVEWFRDIVDTGFARIKDVIVGAMDAAGRAIEAVIGLIRGGIEAVQNFLELLGRVNAPTVTMPPGSNPYAGAGLPRIGLQAAPQAAGLGAAPLGFGGPINITNYVNNPVDAHTVAYRTAQEIMRMRR